MERLRKPAVAGMFYPGEKEELTLLVSSLMNHVKGTIEPGVKGLVSPHAGYVYSGKTAAYGFRQIRGRAFKTVVVLSPSHREYFDGVCIYEGDAYLTPLGKVPVDHTISDALCTNDKFVFRGRAGHGAEHGIEVQLPFLQLALGEFKLVPVVMGDQRRKNVEKLSEKLSEVISEEILIVASSDLSHFYSHERADSMDLNIEKRINGYDYEGLQDDLDESRAEACGGGLITTMMKAFSRKGNSKASVLYRNDSSEASGDKSEVVGYLSAIIYN